MITKQLLRRRLIKKIDKLSDEKLDSLVEFFENIENDINSNVEILSFAGIFRDLDQETLNDLTTNLHIIRQRESERIK